MSTDLTKAGTPRKRAPGGGRKPGDGRWDEPTQRVTLRVPESFRERAEAIAAGYVTAHPTGSERPMTRSEVLVEAIALGLAQMERAEGK